MRSESNFSWINAREIHKLFILYHFEFVGRFFIGFELKRMAMIPERIGEYVSACLGLLSFAVSMRFRVACKDDMQNNHQIDLVIGNK